MLVARSCARCLRACLFGCSYLIFAHISRTHGAEDASFAPTERAVERLQSAIELSDCMFRAAARCACVRARKSDGKGLLSRKVSACVLACKLLCHLYPRSYVRHRSVRNQHVAISHGAKSTPAHSVQLPNQHTAQCCKEQRSERTVSHLGRA